MNTKEICTKLQELIKDNKELGAADCVFRCYDENGLAHDISIFDVHSWNPIDNTGNDTYCLETSIYLMRRTTPRFSDRNIL